MVERRVPAIASQLRGVRRCAEDAATDFGLGPVERHQFVFAVNEVVTNAIRHGRPFYDGTIGLRIDVEGDTLICAVSDRGQFGLGGGEQGQLAESGRGLAAIKLLMDRIELSASSRGTTIRLHKRRSRDPEPNN